jgi:DNA-binding transcriptional LysR family regulator
VRSRLVVSNLESAYDAARAGIGITVVFSYHVTDSIKSGQLRPLLQDFQPPPRYRGSGRASAICRNVPRREGELVALFSLI